MLNLTACLSCFPSCFQSKSIREISPFHWYVLAKSFASSILLLLNHMPFLYWRRWASFISHNIIELYLKPWLDKWEHIFNVGMKSASCFLTTNVFIYKNKPYSGCGYSLNWHFHRWFNPSSMQPLTLPIDFGEGMLFTFFYYIFCVVPLQWTFLTLATICRPHTGKLIGLFCVCLLVVGFVGLVCLYQQS